MKTTPAPISLNRGASKASSSQFTPRFLASLPSAKPGMRLLPGLCASLVLGAGCQTAHQAYPPPDLGKTQVACVVSTLKMLEVDGQAMSPRGKEYLNHTHLIDLDLLPGEHTFLMYAGRDNPLEEGTRVSGTPVGGGMAYNGNPVRFSLTARLEAGKQYTIELHVDKPSMSLGESLTSSIGIDFKRKMTVVLVTDKKVVATAKRL